jgi:hypothetical protein
MAKSKTNSLKFILGVVGLVVGLWLMHVIGDAFGASKPYTITNGDGLIAIVFIVTTVFKLHDLEEKLDKILERE